jgi:hypothetical protein
MMGTCLTGPISSSVVFVSSERGVEARTHTSPFDNFIAVERPPQGRKLNLANGLHAKVHVNQVCEDLMIRCHFENVVITGVT